MNHNDPTAGNLPGTIRTPFSEERESVEEIVERLQRRVNYLESLIDSLDTTCRNLQAGLFAVELVLWGLALVGVWVLLKWVKVI